MTKSDAAVQFSADLKVPFERIAKFVRQVTHDVRNGLNAMDLQAAYVTELISEPDAAEELKRLRALIQQSARSLQGLSANFWLPQPNLIPYNAKIFIEDFRERHARLHPEVAAKVQWTDTLEKENVNIDIEMMFTALVEVFQNAFQFGASDQPITARVLGEEGRFVLEVREEMAALPSAAESWGLEPFVSTRRGAYGLGLFRARMILTAHGGDIQFSPESGCTLLTTRVSLPFVD